MRPFSVALLLMITATASDVPRGTAGGVVPRAGTGRVTPPETPVALVNGHAITAGQLAEETGRRLPTGPHLALDDRKKAIFRDAALEELIVRELAYEKAKTRGMKVTPAEIEAVVRKIKARYKTAKSFEEALQAEHLTAQQFRDQIERDLLLRKIYRTDIESKAPPSPAATRQYYENNKSQFFLPESVHLWHIAIKTSPGAEGRSKKRAEEIYSKLLAGSSFSDLAYKFSEDDYRVLGGDYGSLHKGQLNPELERTVFAVKPDTFPPPFQTKFGWHIIRVTRHDPGRQLSFSEVRKNIEDSLLRKRQQQLRTEFVRELRAGAKIDYLKR